MNPRTRISGINPFEYGSAVPPERFWGRHAQRADVKNRIGGISAQCVSIVGLRRSGKSSLLRYVRERTTEFCPPEQNPLVIPLDLQAQQFRTPTGIMEGVRRGIEASTGRAPWNPDQNNDGFAVSDGLEALRDRKIRLLALLDEFERIGARLGEFQDWGEDWRSKASAGCLTLVIATQRPLPDVYMRCGLTSPFGNIFSTTTLGILLPEEWRESVHRGFSQSGKAVSDADLALIDDLAGGLPFYVQMAAALLWQHGDRWQTIEAFRAQSEPRFDELWNDLTSSEQNALRHVVGRAPLQVSERTATSLLHRHGILRPNGDLFSSLFADFVRVQK